jgi:uncharacterized protein (TIGR04141 family)
MQIPDLTDKLRLIPIRIGEKEGEYNERLGKYADWLVLDKKLFNFGAYDRFEISDLLTQEKQFLCVKKMTSSATLSHLFAQGSVSAKLLRTVPEVEAKIKELYETKWIGTRYEDKGSPLFIYVNQQTKQEELAIAYSFLA